MDFDNGYGISVIRTSFSYGQENGLYECAVMKEGHLCYDTGITNDVIGRCTPEEVTEIMCMIQNLKKMENKSNIEKSKSIAELYSNQKPSTRFIDCYMSAISMAEYKDKQFDEFFTKLVSNAHESGIDEDKLVAYFLKVKTKLYGN